MYKYCEKFITCYSPSSVGFEPNYWIGMTKDQFDLKKHMMYKYDINMEQSYTKKGYYLKSESNYDFGTRYYHENFVNSGDERHYECYKILKWKE